MIADDYVTQLKPPQKDVATALLRMVRETTPEGEERFSWGHPCFYLNGPMIYISGSRDHVKLGFFEGAVLADPLGLLEGTGKKLRHIKVHSLNELQQRAEHVRKLIIAAAALRRRQMDTPPR